MAFGWEGGLWWEDDFIESMICGVFRDLPQILSRCVRVQGEESVENSTSFV